MTRISKRFINSLEKEKGKEKILKKLGLLIVLIDFLQRSK